MTELNNIMNIPEDGDELRGRMVKKTKRPLSDQTREYLIDAYNDSELKSVCLSFNGKHVNGSSKIDRIFLAVRVRDAAKAKGDVSVASQPLGKIANALGVNRRQGGIGEGQLLEAATSEYDE